MSRTKMSRREWNRTQKPAVYEQMRRRDPKWHAAWVAEDRTRRRRIWWCAAAVVVAVGVWLGMGLWSELAPFLDRVGAR